MIRSVVASSRSRRGRAPLVALLFVLMVGCTGLPNGVEPVAGFDIDRYAGTWYEIARLDHRFERGLTNITATYQVRDDGTVGVLNRGFDRTACEWKEAEGRARFQGSPDVASLSVTFFWPFSGGYHVFALDHGDYAYALVSGPSRDYLWILAREPDLAPEVRADLIQQARVRGFPVADLIFVDHSPTTCTSAKAD